MFEFGYTEGELSNGGTFQLHIDHDFDAGNPLEDFDGMGTIHSLNHRHRNHIDLDKALNMLGKIPLCRRCGSDQLEYRLHKMGQQMIYCEYCGTWSVEKRLHYPDHDCVPLSYWQHSNCAWGVAGSLSHYQYFRWDGTEFAGVWEPDEVCINELDLAGAPGTNERVMRAWELAKSACEVYTKWCNGEVYFYRLEVFDAEGESLGEESCAGFYGWDDVEEGINNALAGLGVVLS